MQRFTCSKTVSVWPGNRSIRWLFLICSLALLIPLTRVAAAPLLASPCTLYWDQSQDPTVGGFILYFGIADSTTTNRLDVGLTNMVTLQSLLASSNYFFYLVAYSTNGIESTPSIVINYTPQALAGLELTPSTNQTLIVHFLTATDAVCHVEYTPSLNPPQWQTLSNATADANGNVTITDPRSGNPPARFYRTAVP